jgi:hypothetical protein
VVAVDGDEIHEVRRTLLLEALAHYREKREEWGRLRVRRREAVSENSQKMIGFLRTHDASRRFIVLKHLLHHHLIHLRERPDLAQTAAGIVDECIQAEVPRLEAEAVYDLPTILEKIDAMVGLLVRRLEEDDRGATLALAALSLRFLASDLADLMDEGDFVGAIATSSIVLGKALLVP